MSNEKKKEALHLGIAERGKLYALEGNHAEALRHYREAIRLTVQHKSPEIFFQHYTQCVMESLELSGAHQEVINYCEKARSFFEEQSDTTTYAKRSHAAVLEKQAVQHVYQGENGEALPLLKEAQALVGRGTQKLTDDLLNWVQRGYQISNQQLQQAQERHQYFIVRKDKVNPDIAIDLPKQMNPLV
ncbi:MAG TPA: peptidylprolyl isomerase [Cytophagales bacterium]|nr:peptidylprolyl isomerase [Cytophagales bacterium]HAA17697.1 peptidylprolyl isomerase [Cytophagales bacterium]HAP62489.1 peptidylprolyl isomerase [Cytophagales bacterium]